MKRPAALDMSVTCPLTLLEGVVLAGAALTVESISPMTGPSVLIMGGYAQ